MKLLRTFLFALPLASLPVVPALAQSRSPMPTDYYALHDASSQPNKARSGTAGRSTQDDPASVGNYGNNTCGLSIVSVCSY